jgi:hypothetical protein
MIAPFICFALLFAPLATLVVGCVIVFLNERALRRQYEETERRRKFLESIL